MAPKEERGNIKHLVSSLYSFSISDCALYKYPLCDGIYAKPV